MEVLEAIRTRRSVRKFTSQMPDQKDLETVIEAGLYAANGMGRQDPVILAITSQPLRNRISEMNCAIGGWPKGFDPFYGAPVILMVLGHRSCVTRIYDGSLVLGNMMLAAHSLGLSSIWIHRAKEEAEAEEFRQLLQSLGISEEMEGIGHLALGYAAQEPGEPSARNADRVFYL